MKKLFIVKHNADYQLIIQKGRSLSSKQFKIYYYPNTFEYSRFGFAFSKKKYNAVIRNRVRRQMKSLVHQIMKGSPLQKNWDIVIIAKAPFLTMKYQDNLTTLKAILNKI